MNLIRMTPSTEILPTRGTSIRQILREDNLWVGVKNMMIGFRLPQPELHPIRAWPEQEQTGIKNNLLEAMTKI